MAGTQKKGFMARFRRPKAEVEPVKANSSKESKKKDNVTSVTKEGVPVVSAASQEPFSISAVRGVEPKSSKTTEKGSKMSRRVKRETVVLAAAPSARDSAFSGPPRYDWIDIETSAAIKVQSVFRRNKAMSDLEAKGLSTSAMRNRRRRRRARSRKVATTEDAPGLLQCCGLGLMFGDASEEDDAANRAYAKAQYEERSKLREEEEARKRQYKPRTKEDRLICEAVETVY